ncbi:iron complex transport system permease protein [Arthrobacter alpinus]|uniref:Iron complex transport system permease protein n=1 Tax=Arthrobacter alpinus TaxID=656366 RepID=A0A1H5EX91_9MICC|nr:iron chelate uptake ABC transporter family permease subunit [Arthrobacter alpinus]SED95746.1 iron complex transport system permease protein [Arthrobacter alpinus]
MTPSKAATASTPPDVQFGYRRLVLGSDGFHTVLHLRAVLVAVGFALFIIVLAAAALMNGDYELTLAQVIAVLNGSDDGLARTVVLDWRLPRILSAILLGGALAVSGAIFQTLTRNPLASPDIVGLSHGAFTGMLLTVLAFGTSWALMATGAVAGGVLAALAIYMISYRGGIQGFRFIIVGIAISAMLASVNTWILLQVELETAMFASAWGAGTLNAVTPEQVNGAALAILVLFVAIATLAPALRQLDLGDDAAAALGLRLGRVRLFAILIGVGLVCVATAVAGPVAFVALAAPQIAQRAARTPYLPLVLSALAGGAILLGSDFIAQHLLPHPLPVGVVTVVVGGAYLVWAIIAEIRKRA